MALDIVCGKEMDVAMINARVGQIQAGAPETDPTKGTKSFYEGKWYYFCSMACRHRFVATPDEFLSKQGA
jgi:YHS domain-containing protein